MSAPLSLLLLLVAAGCLAAGSPAHSRVRRSFPALQGGIPLGTIFALCESDDGNIGPCLAELLTGVINGARPSFATGVKIGRDTVVLEPLSLDDVEPKKDKTFQAAITNLRLYGVGTLHINNITFDDELLALDLSFDNVTAAGDVELKYLFLRANFGVQLELSQLGVKVKAKWALEVNPEEETRLDIVLSNATAEFEVGKLKSSLSNLGHLGTFVQRIINKNSDTLVKFLIPDLEKSVTKKLNRKLNRIKIAD